MLLSPYTMIVFFGIILYGVSSIIKTIRYVFVLIWVIQIELEERITGSNKENARGPPHTFSGKGPLGVLLI